MDNFRLTPLTVLDESSGVLGLNVYLKSLEKHYFSEVSLRSYTSTDGCLEMAIDMRCNLKLQELLGFHYKGRWGSNGSLTSPLKSSFDLLTKQNDLQLDIEELTFFLNDTNIIIKKIYNQSIPELLDEVIYEIANHYIYVTKGLTEKPYEIFIPVFEDNITESIPDINNCGIGIHQKTPKSYFEFWGVYLESEEDALIYDVSRNMYIPANLDIHI